MLLQFPRPGFWPDAPPTWHFRDYLSAHWGDVLSAAFFGILIAIVGIAIAWRQLRYAERRDAELDARNQWEKIHKAMLEFRFRREILSTPVDFGLSGSEAALEAAHALHLLHGELERAPDSPLVENLSNYLNDYQQAEQWRTKEFVAGFDPLTQQVALKCR